MLCGAIARCPPINWLGAIVDEVLGFSVQEQHDDITLIVAKRTEG